MIFTNQILVRSLDPVKSLVIRIRRDSDLESADETSSTRTYAGDVSTAISRLRPSVKSSWDSDQHNPKISLPFILPKGGFSFLFSVFPESLSLGEQDQNQRFQLLACWRRIPALLSLPSLMSFQALSSQGSDQNPRPPQLARSRSFAHPYVFFVGSEAKESEEHFRTGKNAFRTTLELSPQTVLSLSSLSRCKILKRNHSLSESC